ncbi:hypothetical protein FZEAL_1104 [Fusarium zealandicum]|uniref:Uncharacterized protein n=1 Tax=Fusarium zealandicum TaxID=1053134 RepID=A0A8H4UTV1_9HYPO|nr:hypothetical protein FZEAL_1104 [Fusarium zealandicum]
MGILSKALRRRRRASQDVDLLSAAFGFPFRLGGLRKEENPRRIRITYDSDDNDESESATEFSMSSDDEEEDEEERRSIYEKPPPPKPTSTRRRHRHGHHRKSSTVSASRKSPRPSTSRSTSRRSTTQSMPKQHVISRVRPSATFPPHIPLHLSRQHCTIPASSTFSASNLNQPFGTLPVQQPQQLYYQDQVAFVPPRAIAQVPVQTPQYITTSAARPVAARPQPPPVAPPTPVDTRSQHKGQQSSRTLPSWAKGSGPYARELQRIQRHIDEKMADLAEEPTSRVLRRDLRHLQDRLNETLNKAIAGNDAAQAHDRRQSMSTSSIFSLPANKSPTPPAERVSNVNGTEARDAPVPTKDIPVEPQTTRRLQQRKLHEQRDESPERVRRHHFCSDCGNIRSVRFHKRYPLEPRQKSKFNLCESCREERINRGVVQNYHFCFNCGCVRSKSFNDQHRILPGEPILPNYCGMCRLEVQADEGIAETSVLGLKSPRGAGKRATQPVSDSEEDFDSLTANYHRSHHSNYKSEPIDVRKKTHETRARTATTSQSQKHRGERPHVRHPEPLNIRISTPSPDPNDASPISPYCPTRIIGSAGRRAQRKSSGQLDTEPTNRTEKAEKPNNYRAPYIENSTSVPSSRRDTSSPVFSKAKSDSKEKKKAKAAKKQDNRHSGPKHGSGEDRPSSSSSRRTRDQNPRDSPRLREKSIESDRSNDSYPNSSKSSGSKTVRFKQSVDIRTTLPPDWDSQPSEAEGPLDNNRASRSASSPLISRNGSYKPRPREEDEESHNYLHPHLGRSAMKSPGAYREFLQTPDNFRAGTPSKGYSQGAFSKDFGQEDDWNSFRSPRQPPEDFYSGGDGFQNYYDGPAEESHEFARGVDNDGYGEQFMESTTSLPSFLPMGGGFGSFFNNFADRQTTPSPEEYRPYTNVNTVFTDPDLHNFGADEGHGQAGSNPYYTPRKRRFPKFSFYSSPRCSEKSSKQEKPPLSPGRADEFFWNNGFDPVPIVEEAGSVGDFTPEDQTDLLEYHSISDSSSIETDDDEDLSDRDFSTSSEDTEENIATKLLLQRVLHNHPA